MSRCTSPDCPVFYDVEDTRERAKKLNQKELQAREKKIEMEVEQILHREKRMEQKEQEIEAKEKYLEKCYRERQDWRDQKLIRIDRELQQLKRRFDILDREEEGKRRMQKRARMERERKERIEQDIRERVQIEERE